MCFVRFVVFLPEERFHRFPRPEFPRFLPGVQRAGGGPHPARRAAVASLRALSAGRAFERAALRRHWPARARGGQPAVGAAGGAP